MARESGFPPFFWRMMVVQETTGEPLSRERTRLLVALTLACSRCWCVYVCVCSETPRKNADGVKCTIRAPTKDGAHEPTASVKCTKKTDRQ